MTYAEFVKNQIAQGYPGPAQSHASLAKKLISNIVGINHEKAAYAYSTCSIPDGDSGYLPALFVYEDGSALVFTECFVYSFLAGPVS